MLKRFCAIAGALVLTGMLAQSASASLLVDLQLADGTKAKTLAPADIGKPITFKMYATVTGADASSYQWLGQVVGNVVSGVTGSSATTTGGTWKVYTIAGKAGGMSATLNVWNGSGAQPGKIQDLNGDGIMDIGTTDYSQLAGDAWAARTKYDNGVATPNGQAMSSAALTYATEPIQSATATFQIGTLIWTPSGALAQGTTSFGPQVFASPANSIWLEDTGLGNQNDTGAYNYYDLPTTGVHQYNSSNGVLLAGTPVVLTGLPVPEPASLGLLALGALLGLRRRSA